MTSSDRKAGRPRVVRTPEEEARQLKKRRKQLADAQARHRQRVADEMARRPDPRDILQLQNQVSSLATELEHARAQFAANEADSLRFQSENQALRDALATAQNKLSVAEETARYAKNELYRWQEANRKLESELFQARSRISKNISIKADSPPKRAEILFDAIVNGTNWQGEKSENSTWTIRQHSERLATVTRQAKTARTAIAKVEVELKEIVTPGEKQVLEFARQALDQITEASEIAKKKGSSLAEKREKHDEAVRLAKEKAIRDVFKADTPEDKLVVALQCERRYYGQHDLDCIRDGEAFERSYTYPNGSVVAVDWLSTRIEDAYRTALNTMVTLISAKDPKDALPAAQALFQERQDKFKEARELNAALLEKVNAELVMRRIEKGNNKAQQ